MSMNNKQRWMGAIVLLGGGVLLAALLLKGQEEIHQSRSQNPSDTAMTESELGHQPLKPLTLDVQTEQRLLEEQRRQREKSVAEQEARAAEFLAMQQQAEADAARKAAEEYAALNAHRTGQQSSDNIPPELIEDEQEKQKRLAAEKAEAEKKAETLKAETERKAQANMSAEEKQKAKEQERIAAEKKAVDEKRKADDAKKTAEAEEKRKVDEAQKKAEIEEKRKADDAKKKAEAEEKRKADDAKKKAEADEKRKAEEAKKKADAEKARKLLEGDDGKQWMVQVALAANEANADAIAAKLKAKGYKVTKSQTSKGIRIMVGPAKDREAADTTRKKIASDESLNMKSAWVNEWTPLDKRN